MKKKKEHTDFLDGKFCTVILPILISVILSVIYSVLVS